ncbi:uncharacterized protein LOC144447594 [Glandiceps talaboti]
MPIITKFLWWENTKEATRGAAMFGAMLSTVNLVWYMYAVTIKMGSKPQDEFYDTLYKVWFAMLFVYSVHFIQSCILTIGADKGTYQLMLIYIIWLVLFEMTDTGHIVFILQIYGLNSEGVMELAFYIFTFLINIPVFIIILSEYQRTSILPPEEENEDENDPKKEKASTSAQNV